jgi:hypothetical protein
MRMACRVFLRHVPPIHMPFQVPAGMLLRRPVEKRVDFGDRLSPNPFGKGTAHHVFPNRTRPLQRDDHGVILTSSDAVLP